MEVRAVAKSVRISPRKVRLVADAIRNLPIEEAFRVLSVTQKRASQIVEKTLNSAIANATYNAKLNKDNLYIESIMINEAQAMKRFHPSTRGRIHAYKKRGSHVTIVLKEKAAVKKSAAADTASKKTVSERADAAVEAALYGKEEKKQSGVKALASRLTGKKKTEKKEVKK